MTPKRASRRRKDGPTIGDVAAHAGVSPMTVSRVINAEPGVRPATREAVQAAIAALAYVPNAAARSLASASQRRLGLLYSNPSAAYLSAFLVGILDQASRAHVQLVVEQCELDGTEGDVVRALVASGIDGLLLPPPLCDSPQVLAALGETGVPAVAVATGRAPNGLSVVSIDDRRAARAMTAHLLALGHRRIGFVAGNPNQSASALRLYGYRDALADAGLAIDEALIVPGLFTYRSGLDAADRLLDLDRPPSAIFASNDDMAAAAVAVAHRRGLDVPRDLTVCGFDDTNLATTIWPELTTIRQPIAAMSCAAVDLLLETIRGGRPEGGAAHGRLLLDFALIRRQSDAPPSGATPFS